MVLNLFERKKEELLLIRIFNVFNGLVRSGARNVTRGARKKFLDALSRDKGGKTGHLDLQAKKENFPSSTWR